MQVETTQLLTIAEAARESRYMSESALRSRIARGELQTIKIGASVMIPRAALAELLKSLGTK